MDKKILPMMMAMAAMRYGPMDDIMGEVIPKNKLRGIDIDKEYELIKQKKSRLSSNMRKLVLSCKDA